VRSGLIQTKVSCREKDKAIPAFTHLVREANCAGVVLCNDRGRLSIAFSCSRGEDTRKLKRSVNREMRLLRHHGLAAARRRR